MEDLKKECSCEHEHEHEECSCKKEETSVQSKPIIVKKDMFKNLSRNDKCPCGSGLKFKKCHLNQVNKNAMYEIKYS